MNAHEPHARVQARGGYIPADETPLIVSRPSPWFILITIARTLVLLALVTLSTYAGLAGAGLGDAASWVLRVGGLLIVLRVGWQVGEWLSRRYVLTPQRIVAVGGLLRRAAADLPLRHVRQIGVSQSVPERLLGLGTITVATAGAAGFVLNWVAMRRPQDVLVRVREVVDAAQHQRAGNPVPVIGLVGGIGAGKSEVARLLGTQGFVVIDADALAKAALDRPEVRAQLVDWWGGTIVAPDGRIDTRALGGIVFRDADARRKLEGLTHPIVKASRRQVVEQAARDGKAGVVIDAPLLFEAGSDADCDLVVFVDSPREQRQERVKARQGWDEAELKRRESAQLSLEEKRSRADLVVVNDAGRDDLARRVLQLLPRLKLGV